MKKLAVFVIISIALLALASCGEPARTADPGTSSSDTADSTSSAATPDSGSDIAGPDTPTSVPDDNTTGDESTPAPENSTDATAAPADTTDATAAPADTTDTPTATPAPDEDTTDDESTPTPVPDTIKSDTNGSFTITTSDGAFVRNGNVYTIVSAGNYTLSGKLDGRVVVSAPDTATVTLNLKGVTLTSSDDSPLFVKTAGNVRISLASGTGNSIIDKRAAHVSDDDDDDSNSQGKGALTAKCDLTLQGSGTLTVEAGYNNGIHCTKDLKVRDLTLKVTAVNNAVKGNNSVTVESGVLTLISSGGDGIKTEDSAISSKGNQQGSVVINGGDVTVYAAGDGIQAAYNYEMNGGKVTIYNGDNSTYTDKNASVDSYKGVKVKNILKITDGTLSVSSQDDGLHADYGDKLDNGSKGQGCIVITGGTVAITTSTTTSLGGDSGGFGGGPGGGPGGPGGGSGGWGGFGGGGFGGMGFGQGGGGADAIHADNTLSITGGTIVVSTSYEGLEANIIDISGGDITIAASDDGINAAKKIGISPSVTISGGTVDITMGSGDTDGIDSNGSFTMTGGLVIVRGAPNSTNGMATGLDCDGQAKLTGGTLIQLGPRETVPTLGSGCYTLNFGSSGGRGGRGGGPGGWGGPGSQGGQQTTGSYSFGSGTWTLSGLGISFTVADGCTYSGAVVYSADLTNGSAYTMSNGSTTYTATAS